MGLSLSFYARKTQPQVALSTKNGDIGVVRGLGGRGPHGKREETGTHFLHVVETLKISSYKGKVRRKCKGVGHCGRFKEAEPPKGAQGGKQQNALSTEPG